MRKYSYWLIFLLVFTMIISTATVATGDTQIDIDAEITVTVEGVVALVCVLIIAVTIWLCITPISRESGGEEQNATSCFSNNSQEGFVECAGNTAL